MLAELARQVRHATPTVLRRQIDRLDELAAELEADRAYPEAWIVFRITGYRPEEPPPDSRPATAFGGALLADLSALGEHLSHHAHLTPEDCPAWPGLDELAERWGVSRRTVERRRQLGLIARRVRDAGGVERVVFHPEGVARFERRAQPTPRAPAITAPESAVIFRRARRYRDRLGWGLTRTAQRLGERLGRSTASVRRVLMAHDAGAGLPIFPRAEAPGAREDRVCARAMARGIEPGAIGARLSMTPTEVRRAAVRERARRLQSLDLGGPVLPTFAHPEAREVLLAPEPVRTGLDHTPPGTLVELIASMRERPRPDPAGELARLVAYRYLVHAAGEARAQVGGRHPSAELVDRAETDLRHAARLNAAIVRALQRVILDGVEEAIGRPLDALRSEQAWSVLLGALRTAAREVARADPARMDPGRGGRIAGRVSLAVAREAQRARAAMKLEASPGRASARIPAHVRAPDWTRRIEPWQAWLEPDPRLRAHAASALPGQTGLAVLVARYGWDGTPPRTIAAIAAQLGSTPPAIARAERAAIRRAMAHARGGFG